MLLSLLLVVKQVRAKEVIHLLTSQVLEKTDSNSSRNDTESCAFSMRLFCFTAMSTKAKLYNYALPERVTCILYHHKCFIFPIKTGPANT